tara:strand:- start:536 stop:850 length:315 start_codon:yes stop_codon:yes gene_type:complete
MEIKIILPITGLAYAGKERTLDLCVKSVPEQYYNDLDPEQARRLAAALVRAAETVEAHINAQAEVDAIVARPLAKTAEVKMVRKPGVTSGMSLPDGEASHADNA